MHGCGDKWCDEPWFWMTAYMLLALATWGAIGSSGSEGGGGGNWA